MLIDDEQQVRELISDALREEGYEVDLAINGKDGLSQFLANPSQYDVVILDLNMPEMSGSETLTHIQKSRPQTKVIITTGYLENNEVNELMRNGASRILRKPFEIDELLDAVVAAVPRH